MFNNGHGSRILLEISQDRAIMDKVLFAAEKTLRRATILSMRITRFMLLLLVDLTDLERLRRESGTLNVLWRLLEVLFLTNETGDG